MKKWIIAIVVIAIITVVGFLLFQRNARQRQAATLKNFQIVSAERGNLLATIGATGSVRSNQSAILALQTSGNIENVAVGVGDQVSHDQLLATLEQTSLPQNVILAQADLANSQQALEDLYRNAETAKLMAMQDIVTFEQAVKDAQYQIDNFTVPAAQAGMNAVEAVDSLKIKLDQARQAFEPYKNYPSGDSTRQDLKKKLDEAQNNYNTAVKRLKLEYDLEVAQANLKTALEDYKKWQNGPIPADIESTKARIAAAQATINLARLLAPFNGTVTDVNIKPGDQVSPGTMAFQVDDLSHLLVDVQVSEIDVNSITPGQKVMLTFDAIPGKEYNGIVQRIAAIGNTTPEGVDYTATVELVDADPNIHPGMTAAVNFISNQVNDVLLVPNRAVRVIDGKRVVYILVNGQPSPVSIQLGATSDTVSEVTGGDLKAGDQIILNPPAMLTNSGGPPSFFGR